MMDLQEILRGIGQQAASSMPHWSTPAIPEQHPAAAPQLPSFNQGSTPFASYLAGSSAPASFPQFPNPFAGFGSAQQPMAPFADSPQPFAGTMGQQDQFADFAKPPASMASFPSSSDSRGTTSSVSAAGTPTNDQNAVEAYIRQAAAARHIDPDTAVQVWSGEGKSNYAGDQNSSFGPYQLHYGNVAPGGNAVGGLGDQFTAATGMDARDPSTWQAQIDWSLNYAAKNGWGPWHGYTGSAWDGIGSYNAPAQSIPGTQASNSLVNMLTQNGHKLGEAYDWGGSGSDGRGFDCSGLVSWFGQKLGVPGIGARETTFTLFPKTQAISENEAQPGDLVFYNMDSPRADQQHVAVYLGGGKILQSGGTQTDVNVGQAHQAVGSAPIFRRYAPFTQAVGGLMGGS